MSTISSTPTSFSTFYSSTTTIPAEITSHIIEYVIVDTQLLPMGGGVGIRRAHYLLVSTSHALRTNYLRHPYPTTAKHRTTALIYLNLGEALYFNDLWTLATFFQEGPGQDIALLYKVRFLSISYVNYHATTD